jgi:hypothetical protein
VWNRRTDLGSAAVTAAAVYAGLRIGLAGGALAPYCEEHGYFFGERGVCIDRLSALAASQVAYNVIATGVGTLLPGLLLDDGRIGISPRWLLMSTLLLPVAVVGWLKGPTPVRWTALVVGFTVLSSFMLYRSRNHMAALAAVSIAVGVGLPIAGDALRRKAPHGLIPSLAIAALVSIVATRTLVAHRLISDRVEQESQPDACDPDVPRIDRDFKQRLWQRYGLELPECGSIGTSR